MSYRFLNVIKKIWFSVWPSVAYSSDFKEKRPLPGAGFKPGSPALRAGGLLAHPPRRTSGPS